MIFQLGISHLWMLLLHDSWLISGILHALTEHTFPNADNMFITLYGVPLLDFVFFLPELILALIGLVALIVGDATLLWYLGFVLFLLIIDDGSSIIIEGLGIFLFKVALTMYLFDDLLIFIFDLFDFFLQIFKLFMQWYNLLLSVFVFWILRGIEYSVLVVCSGGWVNVDLLRWWYHLLRPLKWTHWIGLIFK